MNRGVAYPAPNMTFGMYVHLHLLDLDTAFTLSELEVHSFVLSDQDTVECSDICLSSQTAHNGKTSSNQCPRGMVIDPVQPTPTPPNLRPG